MVFQFYHYAPSMPASILFVALFALTTGVQSYQTARTKSWFLIPFVCGGFCEVIGFIGRTYSGSQSPTFTLGPYVVQAVFLLVAPALYAASIYMTLGRISDMVEGHHLLPVSRRWITRTFVLGDVICFMMQAAGASLMASTNLRTRDVGTKVVVGGLFVQIVFFGGFVLTSVLFHSRIKKTPTDKSQTTPYARHLVALYITSILIFIRSIVRVVEFLQGFDGYVISHEVFLYVFDALPMLAVMLVFNFVHPSEVSSLITGGEAIRGFKLVRLNPESQEVAESRA
ncbi:RTA1-domain-containing protein [Thozetella sp. PMI_491]|nr:RTA1-domain-containing protein [Thozetella sp. PMI_491]